MCTVYLTYQEYQKDLFFLTIFKSFVEPNPKIPATCFSNRCYFVWNRNKFNGTYLYSKKYNILIPIQIIKQTLYVYGMSENNKKSKYKAKPQPLKVKQTHILLLKLLFLEKCSPTFFRHFVSN